MVTHMGKMSDQLCSEMLRDLLCVTEMFWAYTGSIWRRSGGMSRFCGRCSGATERLREPTLFL